MGLIVTNPGSSGGGGGTSINSGIATIDFGTLGSSNSTIVSLNITGQSGILSTSKIVVNKRIEATSNHTIDEVLVENWAVDAGNIIQGTGFTIYGKSTLGRTNGQYNVTWEWI